MLGYFAGPSVHLVDTNALADPLLARMPAAHNPSWRPGHFLRGVPDGYLDTLRSGTNVVADRELARYWEDLALVTRGAIFSRARWSAIARFAFGTNDSLVVKERWLYPNVKRVALADLEAKKPEGAPWDAPGNALIAPVGGLLRIEVGRPAHAARVEISTDHNDDYRLVFSSSGEELGTVTLSRHAGTGLSVHEVAVPPRAVERGYDEIRVVPTGGDESFAVGHVRLLE